MCGSFIVHVICLGLENKNRKTVRGLLCGSPAFKILTLGSPEAVASAFAGLGLPDAGLRGEVAWHLAVEVAEGRLVGARGD